MARFVRNTCCALLNSSSSKKYIWVNRLSEPVTNSSHSYPERSSRTISSEGPPAFCGANPPPFALPPHKSLI